MPKQNVAETSVYKKQRENVYFLFLKIIYLLIIRERGREGEREGEKQLCVVASCTSPPGDLACNLGICPDWELNQQLFGLQASAQSTPARA